MNAEPLLLAPRPVTFHLEMEYREICIHIVIPIMFCRPFVGGRGVQACGLGKSGSMSIMAP